jgi:sulfur dioxygenase
MYNCVAMNDYKDNWRNQMIFKQLLDKESFTYTYFIADSVTKEAVFIDPVDTNIDEYVALLEKDDLQLKYSLETHVHADHVTASGLLRQRVGAKTAVSQLCGAETADIQIQDGDVFEFAGGEKIKAIATPGHTPGSTSFLWRNCIFTGDSLFIDGCGRTDFQGGDPGAQYDSITQRLFTLPDETLVYPGHDYKGRWISNIIQERTTNSRLAGKTREEFIEIMNNLNLPDPKLIDMAVPANRYCGIEEEQANQAAEATADNAGVIRKKSTAQEWVAEAKKQINEIDVVKAKDLIARGNIILLDVREENEFKEGHIDNAILLPRGVLEFKLGSVPELQNKAAPVLAYCRTGGRSALAALTLQNLGYTNVLSIAGGYEAWKKAHSVTN